MPLDPLFQAFQSPRLTLKNRIVMAPMTRDFAPGGLPGDDVRDYYVRRAQGGVGLIVTEGVAVNMAGAQSQSVPRIYGEDSHRAWRPIVDAVHAAGAPIVPQLWHVGVQDTLTVLNPANSKAPIARVGPSGLSGLGEQITSAMNDEDIAEAIAAYRDAAAAARALGFDGIELHGAHGYLIDQFLWDFTNRRDDRYGGTRAERTRFATEVIAACRDAIGPDLPIILRLSQWKLFDYGASLAKSPAELAEIVEPLAAAGVDIFHISTRHFDTAGFEGSDLSLAGWVKKLSGRPTIAVGSVTLASDFKQGIGNRQGGIAESLSTTDDLARVAERLDRGEFDLIAVGRALIANPDWASRIRSGAPLDAFTKDQLATLF